MVKKENEFIEKKENWLKIIKKYIYREKVKKIVNKRKKK